MARTLDRMPDELRRPTRPEPSPVFRKLRFIASCALGGALVTGAAFGHDLSGFDPRTIGAAVGFAAGVLAVVTSTV